MRQPNIVMSGLAQAVMSGLAQASRDTRHQSTLPLLPVDNPRSPCVSLASSYISPPVSHLLRLAGQHTRLAAGRTPPGLSRSRARNSNLSRLMVARESAQDEAIKGPKILIRGGLFRFCPLPTSVPVCSVVPP
uniref:Uncharacterized protein n=1 Tax=Caenorhabditis japonica TaxID=281687 RepID=A0A8R1IEC8_CAEJA